MKFIIDTFKQITDFEKDLKYISDEFSHINTMKIEGIYGSAIKNIKPKIRGKITPRKLNRRKIKNIIQGNKTWLEKDGKRITDIIEICPIYKNKRRLKCH